MERRQTPNDGEAELERRLVERWLYRGGILVLLLVFAVLVTLLSARGLHSLADQILVGVLIACSLVAAGVFVVLRQQDRAVYRRLRDRRRTKDEGRRTDDG